AHVVDADTVVVLIETVPFLSRPGTRHGEPPSVGRECEGAPQYVGGRRPEGEQILAGRGVAQPDRDPFPNRDNLAIRRGGRSPAVPSPAAGFFPLEQAFARGQFPRGCP